MPTYSSHGSHQHGSAISPWLTVPPLDEKLNRKVDRMLGALRDLLPEQTILVHRTDRISRPPRKFAVDLIALALNDSAVDAEQAELTPGEKSDWEGECADMAAVSAEISSRWPKGARPDSLILVTDGRSLWFNPGRPSGNATEWLEAHLSGESPCALIRTSIPGEPLSQEWFESF